MTSFIAGLQQLQQQEHQPQPQPPDAERQYAEETFNGLVHECTYIQFF